MPSTWQEARPEVQVADFDPNIFPGATADEKLLRLWNVNGHLYSSRYTNPEITNLSAIIRLNAVTQPCELAYLYPDDENMKSFQKVSFRELDQLVTKASSWYSCVFFNEIVEVGVTFDYFITMLALLRPHIRVLLLSNRNSLLAHQHLLGQCHALGCIADDRNADEIGCEPGFRQEPVALVRIDELQKFDTDVTVSGFKVDDEWTLPSVIIHSSWTTGMPKPIIHTNRSIALIARHYRLYRDFYIENHQMCAPLFHVGGLSVAIGGLPLGLSTTFPPPNWPPRASAILAGWETLGAMGHAVDCIQIAPALVEDMYAFIESTTNDFTPLAKLKVLQSGGAPFAPALLAKMIALGINMKTIYGQTEIAGPMRTLPHSHDNPHLARLRNLYNSTGWVTHLPQRELWESPEAPNPYRTNDVFREDPPGSGFWTILGRMDDVVVHSNGEKTMAGGVATLLADSGSVIANAAVFGTNRPCTAAVVEVRWETVGSVDSKKIEEMVWDAIQSCNQQIPKHSRIDRSLVLILERDEGLPVTPKGTARRKIAWETFVPAVDMLFDNFLEGSKDSVAEDTSSLTSLAYLSDADYLKSCVTIVCKVRSDVDLSGKSFYEVGIDSQIAVQLRAMLVKRFGPFPLIFVFENPTFEKLLAYLVSLKSKDGVATQSTDDEKVHWIQKTVEKYCHQIDSWKAKLDVSASVYTNGYPAGHAVFLTGANGSLGNALLEVLAQDPTVAKIYCAVRGSDVESKLANSLDSRGYTTDISKSPKLCAVPYDMENQKLGLGNELYEKLQSEVSIVLHNAWRLDPVNMYEADCLSGTMNLLNFCLLGCKKTFAFTSSISAVMDPAMRGQKIQEVPVTNDPRSASGTGYAQSKYMIERITQYYASVLEIPVRLLRVGQLRGHSKFGVWNETEMWPIMFATGLDHLKAMPFFQSTQSVNWLPVDNCAEAIGSIITNGSKDRYTVNNLTHPKPISWNTLLNLLAEASGRTFSIINMSEWAASLEKLGEVERLEVPGLKLLSYFQNMAMVLISEEFEVVAESVVGVEPLDVAAVSNWLLRWCESGFVKGK